MCRVREVSLHHIHQKHHSLHPLGKFVLFTFVKIDFLGYFPSQGGGTPLSLSSQLSSNLKKAPPLEPVDLKVWVPGLLTLVVPFSPGGVPHFRFSSIKLTPSPLPPSTYSAPSPAHCSLGTTEVLGNIHVLYDTGI